MAFEAYRGVHAVHRNEHARLAGSPAIPYLAGGSLHVERKSKAHRNGVWQHDPYERPLQPHHVHLTPCPESCKVEHEHVPVCTDHTMNNCPGAHWIGGHPEPDWPHHVEFDGSSGLWGYTRFTPEEVADQALATAHLAELEDTERQKVRQEVEGRLAVMRARAENDEGFAALVKHLGIDLS